VHSLANLNVYSQDSLTYSDFRTTSIQWVFPTSTNQSISLLEGETHNALVGNEIFELVNVSSGNVIYRIDLRQANATATWGNLPANITSNVSPMGVYNINGLFRTDDWDLIKSPEITLPVDYANNFVYTSTVFINGALSQSWTTSVTVTDLPEMTTPTTYTYPADFAQAIIGGTQVLDLDSNTHTITLTVNEVQAIGNLFANGTSGGNLTSNTITKTITIEGNNQAVNDHLDNLIYQNPTDVYSDWLLTSSLFNPLSNITTVVTQQILSAEGIVLTRGEVAGYTEDTVSYVNNTPKISTTISNLSATYNLTISPLFANTVSNITATSANVSTSWNNTTKSLTITGNVQQINTSLNNVFITPFTDLTADITLKYTLPITLPVAGNTQVSRFQTVICDTIVDEIVNMENITRTYMQNTPGILFPSSVPEITENVDGAVYTVYFTSNAGEFALNDNFASYPAGVSIYSFVGTKQQCNSMFAQLKFYPYKDVSGAGTFTYSQYRNNIRQVEAVVPIIGSLRDAPLSDQNSYTITTSQFFTPTITQARYLNKNITIKGRGDAAQVFSYPNYKGYYRIIPQTTNTPGQTTFTSIFSTMLSAVTSVVSISPSNSNWWNPSTRFYWQGTQIWGLPIDYLNGAPDAPYQPGDDFKTGQVTLEFFSGERGSGYFPGNATSYLSGTLESQLFYGPWTVDFWVYPTDTTSNQRCIFDSRSSGGGGDGFVFRQEGTNSFAFVPGGYPNIGTLTLGRLNNQWQHIAIVKDDFGVVYIYRDGQLQTRTPQGNVVVENYTNKSFRLGALTNVTTDSALFNGYIDEFRVSGGERFSANFTPPTQNYPSNDSNFATISNANATLLLLHFDGGTTKFIDSSPANVAITNRGNVRVSSTIFKF
jgi:hypothetical protein